VSLDPLHEQIVRIAFALPEAEQVALAGGGAMLAHDLVDRPTQDVDLFTPDPAEVTPLTDALAVALHADGAQVRVDRRGPGFTRLAVTVADGRTVVVEVAHDARIREAVQLSFGRVLHPDEVAADKTLALFGRAAARDLVDVAALSDRYALDRLCELAAEKDAGFDRQVFADALSAAAAHSDAAFAELGLGPESVAALRASTARWRAELLGAADRSVTDAVQSFGGRTLPGSEAPGYPSSPRTSERHRSPSSRAGRDGPSLSR
jgi:Nucleotidyl transferase AbiEii toxin, Type IV TA system